METEEKGQKKTHKSPFSLFFSLHTYSVEKNRFLIRLNFLSTSSMAALIPENLSREQCLYLAKLAEQAERYEEMVQFMDKLVLNSTPAGELTVEERNLLSVAYKNVIGSLRAAWRIVSSIEQKEESRKNEEHVHLVKEYRGKVENELSQVCAGILKLLESNLVPSATTSESKVFYLKMKGDYYRYLAEFKIGDERKQAAEDTMNSYKAAQVLFELTIFSYFAVSSRFWVWFLFVLFTFQIRAYYCSVFLLTCFASRIFIEIWN